MKNYFLLALPFLLLTACSMPTSDSPPKIITNNAKTVNVGNYTGSEYKGNYIYGAAMNLAWNDLAKTIIHEPVQLATADQGTLTTLSKLNTTTFTTNDLDEKSYYVKSGYGKKTLDTINQESRAKFPQKTFTDLDLPLGDKDIIAYAYLAKEVEYLTPFTEQTMLFDARYDLDDSSANPQISNEIMKPVPMKKVSSFTASNDKQKENVKVVHYWNDDKFIISLKLKDESDELFVAKGFGLETPDEVIEQMNQYSKEQPLVPPLVLQPGETPSSQMIENYRVPLYRRGSQEMNNERASSNLNENDIFEMPYLDLDYHRDYQEMIGKTLANKGFEKYAIAAMFENIKFKMDDKGAKVENQAVVELTETAHAPENPPNIRRFILDKPFWVIMKRKNSNNPYFILGVKNTEFMRKV